MSLVRRLVVVTLLSACASGGGGRGLRVVGASGERSAQARRRLALVVGNSEYSRFVRLPNARRDAAAVALSLEAIGFDTTSLFDRSLDQLEAGISRFSRSIQQGDLVVVFYAGHGVSFRGTNYLIPVDFDGQDGAALARDAYSLDMLFDRLSTHHSTNILIFDACRDAALGRSLATRSINGQTQEASSGFASMDAPDGSMIVYSTAAGAVAADALRPEDEHSPFTESLLAHLSDRDDVYRVMRSVRVDVARRTDGRQQPTIYSVLNGDVVLPEDLAREAPAEDIAPQAPAAVATNVRSWTPFQMDERWPAIPAGAGSAELRSAQQWYQSGRYYDASLLLQRIEEGDTQATVEAQWLAQLMLARTYFHLDIYSSSLATLDEILEHRARQPLFRQSLPWMVQLSTSWSNDEIGRRFSQYNAQDLQSLPPDLKSHAFYIRLRQEVMHGNWRSPTSNCPASRAGRASGSTRSSS